MITDKIQLLGLFCLDAEKLLNTSAGDCIPQAQPDLPPPATPLEDLCRINARALYLLALIACSGNQACCDQAFEDYTEALAKC